MNHDNISWGNSAGSLMSADLGIIRLWQIMPRSLKVKFLFVFGLTVLTSALEVFSLGALLPFLVALFSPERIWANNVFSGILVGIGMSRDKPVELILATAFIAATLFAGISRLYLLKKSTVCAFELGGYISKTIYKNYISQKYAACIYIDSGSLISAISVKVNNIVYMVALPLLTAMAAIIIGAGMALTMLVVNIQVTIIMFLGFSILYYSLILVTKKTINNNGRSISHGNTAIVKLIQQTVGGVRDIFLSGSRDSFVNIFSQIDDEVRSAQGNNAFIGTAPRFVVETMVMIGVAGIAYFMVTTAKDKDLVFPMLGVIALAAQRLLPLMQQVYLGISTVRGGLESLKDTLHLLDIFRPVENVNHGNKILFSSEIILKNVSFTHMNSGRKTLDNITLTIKKGAKIGIIGTSGSGKSTLVDVIMGLLTPTEGEIKVDDISLVESNVTSWWSNISHVPQDIFIKDDTLKRNIMFCSGREVDSDDDIALSGINACIDEGILSTLGGYDGVIHEGGANLSGGQKQRIGIARALYKSAPILILDEATSALDMVTEDLVMRSLVTNENDRTVIVIAHRVHTLKNCDTVIEMENGKISRIGTYDEICLN